MPEFTTHTVFQNNSAGECSLTGPTSLASRLLKAKGFIPVFFSQEELEVGATLKEQFDIIRNKLEEAYLQPSFD